MAYTRHREQPRTAQKRELFVIDTRKNGPGPVLFSWHPDGTYLATSGSNRLVHIWDRTGNMIEEIVLSSPCVALDWDRDGETLAFIQAADSSVIFWDKNNRRTSTLDTGLKDLTFLKWSRNELQLAVGTARGNLLLYDKRTQRKIPVMGAHTKKITCGDWSASNLLALGGEDRLITISKADGDLYSEHIELKTGAPTEITWSDVKPQANSAKSGLKSSGEPLQTLSANLSGKTIYLYKLDDPQNPFELAFQPKYGNICSFRWFDDGMLMVGFSGGYFVVLSTKGTDIATEQLSTKLFNSSLNQLVFSPSLTRVAACGDNVIKLMDVHDLRKITDTIAIDNEIGQLDRMQWTSDGNILSVSTTSGNLYSFLTKLKVINAAHGNRWAYLSSLRDITIATVGSPAGATAPPLTINIVVEPSFMALGPNHLAVGLNNHAWFYTLDGTSGAALLGEKEYLGTVEDIALNSEYAAVLSRGRVQLHRIDAGPSGISNAYESHNSRVFPEKEGETNITCMALTPEFLIYGTSNGDIVYYLICGRDTDATLTPANVGSFRFAPTGNTSGPGKGIRKIFPNASGSRLVFVDVDHNAWLYNPVSDQILRIGEISPRLSRVMWDTVGWGVFVTFEGRTASTFVYLPVTVSGPQVAKIGESDISHVTAPVLLHNGIVFGQTESGAPDRVILESHRELATHLPGSVPPMLALANEKNKRLFSQLLKLNRLSEAWELSITMKDPACWEALANEALRQLDVGLAIGCFRHLGNAGMVLYLEKLQTVENKNLLAGHMCLLNGEYDKAQQLFLASSRPITALEMQRDLLHWEQALRLAENLAKEEIPYISCAYAQQLEFKGEYRQALELYQRGMTGDPASKQDETCAAGIARTTLRLGEVQKGVAMVHSIGSKSLFIECANILESMKQYLEAASLFEKAGQYDRAAAIYLKANNFGPLPALMPKITSLKLHQQYAKVMEAERNYEEAEKAYEKARDYVSVIRINLDHLHRPEKALALGREVRSAEAARLIAKWGQSIGNFKTAVEFLLMANLPEEAFQLARSHEEMEAFVAALGDRGTQAQYIRVAEYYEARGEFTAAGVFYEKCQMLEKAVDLYIKSGDTEAIDRAIAAVSEARSEELVHKLLDFLVDETAPRHDARERPIQVFKLYLNLGKYGPAANASITIATAEMEEGRYKEARDRLFTTHRTLTQCGAKVPLELNKNLLLVHSYILARLHLRFKDYLTAARLLVRVAKNVSKFPSHVIQILYATVTTCERAGLKRTAWEHASILAQPQYRSQLTDPKQEKAIADLARRRPKDPEPPEETSPCPVCNFDLPNSVLDCPNCKSSLPYCIASGRHMTAQDWSECPACNFPALLPEFTKLVVQADCCPMCDQKVDVKAVARIDANLEAHVKKWVF